MSYFKSTPGINFNNSSWSNTGGVGIGRSTVNQQRADQAALRNIQLPTWSNQGRGTLPGVGAYGNSSQSTTVDCPGGGAFDYTIPPGTYLGQSQVEADELAASYLDEQALQNLLCINTTEISDACLNQSYSASFSATGGTAPYEWNVTDGALPGGLTLDPFSGEITGTATAAGSFTFTVSVSDQLFNSQSQQFTIIVFQITPTSLPSGIVGTAYSQTITVTPALGTLTVSSGALPNSISLTGNTISGTPTVKGTFNFVLRVEYGELICEQAMSIKIWDTDNTAIGTFSPAPDGVTHATGFTLTPGVYKIAHSGAAAYGRIYYQAAFAHTIRAAGGPDGCGVFPINVTGFGNIGFSAADVVDPQATVQAYFAAHPILATYEVTSNTPISSTWHNIVVGDTICYLIANDPSDGTAPSFTITRIGKP